MSEIVFVQRRVSDDYWTILRDDPNQNEHRYTSDLLRMLAGYDHPPLDTIPVGQGFVPTRKPKVQLPTLTTRAWRKKGPTYQTIWYPTSSLDLIYWDYLATLTVTFDEDGNPTATVERA